MPYKDRLKQLEYQRQWIAQRRAQWLQQNGPCVVCGSKENLEVDHIDPTQKVTHKVWSLALEKREAELSKCQVLCADCHLKKTVELFKSKPVIHGTNATYHYRKCRCRPCVVAAYEYEKKRRNKYGRSSRQLATAPALKADEA